MKSIILLTGNIRKKESLENALKKTAINIITKKIWLPEIQSLSCDDVAAFAANYGANILKQPVIKMDSGFFIDDLNGFPGALVSSVDTQIGLRKFIPLISNAKNRKAWITNSIAYCEPEDKPIIFSSTTYGIIQSKLNDLKIGSFIDQLFIPNKDNPLKITMGEIRKKDSNLAMRLWGDAEYQFVKWYIENKMRI